LECLSIVDLSKRSKNSIRATPRFHAPALQGPGKGNEEQTYRHTAKAHIEEDLTGSRLTYAEKERVGGSKERGNDGWAIGGRGTI